MWIPSGRVSNWENRGGVDLRAHNVMYRWYHANGDHKMDRSTAQKRRGIEGGERRVGKQYVCRV